MSQRSAAVRREYARLASRYDRRWAGYIGASLDATLAHLTIEPGARVLDVGCGTGILLERIAQERPDAVLTGVDPSEAMLALARARLGARAVLHECHSEQLPFEASTFQVVVSTSAFHYFHEHERAVSEMHRVLCPGGLLVLTDWCGDFLSSRVRAWSLGRLGRGHFQTFRAAALRSLLEDLGFYDVEVERYRIHWHWGLMTARATRR